MEAVPDLMNYMIAGYTVFSVVMISYLASLYIRWRNLQREQQMLDEIAGKDGG